MKRSIWALGVLLLAGCSTPALKPPPPSAEPVAAQARAMLGDVPGVQQRADAVAAAGLPAVEAGDGFVRLRMRPATIPGFLPEAALSPDGRWLAFTYETPVGPDGQPMVALGAVPLPAGAGEARVIAWYSTPKSTARTSPGLRLAGWLDGQRLALLQGAPAPTRAMRLETVNVEDGTGMRGAWFSLEGEVRYNLARMQVWLTGDRKALMVNTGDIWRVDTASGLPARMKTGLPVLQNGGPTAHAGPDGWTALYGGDSAASPAIPFERADLRTGGTTPLPPAWTRLAWGPDGRFAVLANSSERPGDAFVDADGRSTPFFSRVAIAGPDGKETASLAAPAGWLLAAVHWAGPETLVAEAARLAPDSANTVSHNRIADTAFISLPLSGGRSRILWQAPRAILGGSDWLLAGRWLLIGGRQVPLDGGPNADLPEGIEELPVSSDPDRLIAMKPDGTVVRFAAGSTEAHPVGHTEARPGAGAAAGAPLVRSQLAPGRVLLVTQGALGATWIEIFDLPQAE